jgi:hypothetical protein
LTTFEDDEDDDDSKNPFFMINSMSARNEHARNQMIAGEFYR